MSSVRTRGERLKLQTQSGEGLEARKGRDNFSKQRSSAEFFKFLKYIIRGKEEKRDNYENRELLLKFFLL